MKNLSRIVWSRFALNTQPDDRVSPHFRFHELTISETAKRLRIDNSFPDVMICRCAIYLCRKVMEPVRRRFGVYTPNFRSQALERALKKMPASWKSISQHTLGQACDIEVAGTYNMDLALRVAATLDFDQLILECHNATEAKTRAGCTFLSCRRAWARTAGRF